jgi:hypothetical protein
VHHLVGMQGRRRLLLLGNFRMVHLPNASNVHTKESEVVNKIAKITETRTISLLTPQIIASSKSD